MPITWRNVGATIGANDAASLFRGANRTVMDGLDRLRGAIGTVEQGREDQHEFNVEKDTDAFQAALQNQFTTPEELQAAEEDGSITRLREQYNLADPDVLLNAPAEQEQQLRNDTLAEQEYGLSQAVEAVQPVLQEYRSLENIEDRENFLADPENQELLSRARLMGAVQREQNEFEAATIARNEAERTRTRRNQADKAARLVEEFARADGNFYANKAALEAALDEEGIPADIYGPQLGQYAEIYTRSSSLSPNDAEALMEEAQQQENMVRDVTAQQDIMLQTAEDNYKVDPTAPWETGKKAGFEDVYDILAKKEITENGVNKTVENGWLEAMSMYSSEMRRLDSPRGNDPLEGIPDYIQENKYEILQHAAGSLEGKWWLELEAKEIRGGTTAVAEAVRRSVDVFMRAQENKQKLEDARLAHQRAISNARETARTRVENFENKIRLSRGLRTKDRAEQANEEVDERIKEANSEEETKREPYEIFPRPGAERAAQRARNTREYEVFPSTSMTDSQRILRPLR